MSVEGIVDVVLSPACYWFREVMLPAKSAAQAKKLAPSYFDAIIPEGNYEYAAIEQSEQFWLFAYDPEQIAELIEQSGLKPAQIRAIYLAQTECLGLPHPYRIDDKSVLVLNEGVVSVVASRYVHAEEAIESFLSSSVRSSHKLGISVHRTGWLDEKQLRRLTVAAVLLLLVYSVNYFQLRSQFKEQLAREYALKAHYQLPETSFQLKSLISSLEGAQQRQLRLRTVFKALTQLPLAGSAVTLLAMDAKKADLQILLKDPKDAEQIKSALEKSAKVVSAKVKDNTFYVGIAYE